MKSLRNGCLMFWKNNFVCLTVAECKGLEYNDVIFMEFLFWSNNHTWTMELIE